MAPVPPVTGGASPALAGLGATDPGTPGEQEGARALATLQSMGDALLSTDIAGRVTYLNPVAERLTGWPCAEAAGRPVAEVLSIADAVTREGVPSPLLRAVQENRTVCLETSCVLLHRDGTNTPIEDSAAPIRDAGGQVTGAVMVFRDVTRLRDAARRMAYMARHDALTGLPNRLLLRDRIGCAVALAQRRGKLGALLFLDLDGFKAINDAKGHAAGDLLLRSVAQRLLARVRAADTVSRQGGDEFVVLLSEITHGADAALSARKICDALARPHRGPDATLGVTVSVGISIFPQDAEDADTLLRYADRAMYNAKLEGSGGYRFYAGAARWAADASADIASGAPADSRT